MKCKTHNRAMFPYFRWLVLTGVLLGLTLGFGLRIHFAHTEQSQTATTDSKVAAFDERIKEYIKLRGKSEDKLPKLSKKSTPTEIETNLVTLRTSIVAAREGAKPGDIFTPEIADHLRNIIKQEFKGERLKQLRETVREADTKGVPLRINAPYPETKELIEMPPTLLLKLPKLPKQLHYHFVGRSMLLVDKEARLIVDYMPQALP
jgi:hypothetical protein